MPTHSHLPDSLTRENINTILPPPIEGLVNPDFSDPATLEKLRDTLARQTKGSRTSGNVRLGFADASGPGWRHVDLALSPGEHVVLGRHSHADLRLVGDDAVSLRQLLVIVGLLDERFILEFLDLDGATQVQLADGTLMRSAKVIGDTTFRIRDREVHVVGIDGQSAGPSPVGPAGASIPAPPPHSSPREIAAGTVKGLRIRSSVDGKSYESAPISAVDLERGILIGRTKCFDSDLAKALSECVSRAHLLVRLEAGGALRAYDLSSSWGTRLADGGRVRRATLDPSGDTLHVGHPDDPTTLVFEPAR